MALKSRGEPQKQHRAVAQKTGVRHTADRGENSRKQKRTDQARKGKQKTRHTMGKSPEKRKGHRPQSTEAHTTKGPGGQPDRSLRGYEANTA